MKTNVMRLLEINAIDYQGHEIDVSSRDSGEEVARKLGVDPARVFKTLLTESERKYYVFMVPVDKNLNLKKASQVAGEKKLCMLPEKKLLPLTGYVHGGCSPLGMKKVFPSFLHRTCKNFSTIFFSAGRVGYQVEMDYRDLEKFLDIQLADLVN